MRKQFSASLACLAMLCAFPSHAADPFVPLCTAQGPSSKEIPALDIAAAVEEPETAVKKISGFLSYLPIVGDIVDATTSVQAAFAAGRPMTAEEETGVGIDLAAEVLGAAPLVPDTALQCYVNQVGRWIASQTSLPKLEWHFAVIDSPVVNAYAIPGGYVFVTRGMFDLIENEAQLAGVLGHEMAHVVKRHHIRAIELERKRTATTGLGGLALNQLAESAGLVSYGSLLKGVSTLYSKGLDKDDEYEADIEGMLLAARSGYNPFGLPLVLQKMGKISTTDNSITVLLSSHPQLNARMDSIQNTIGDRLDKYSAGVEQTDRYIKVKQSSPPTVAKPAKSAT
jgi:predicted Zn-dependent protease